MDTEAQHTERDRSSASGPGTDPETEATEERSRSRLSWLPGGGYTVTVLLVVLALLAVNRFVAQPFEIPSTSMQPALHVGDRVVVNKVAYRFGGVPRRGDVVVFDGAGYFGDGDYIKRVVGIGGDRVVCCGKDGRLRINGRPVSEPFLHSKDAPSEVPFDLVVPSGRLFLLGDHRSDSRDSRDHLGSPGGGMVPLSSVIGRAETVLWPLSRWGGLGRDRTYEDVPAPGRGHG